MKTAQTIEQTKAEKDSVEKPNKFERGKHPKSLANLVAPWTPETRPQSPGRPKDVAGEISRSAFENNREEIYKAVTAKLLAGDAYAFSVHSDRGYGKLKERKEITHVYEEVQDADLKQRIADLERDLGLAAAIDDAGRVGIAAAGTSKTNGHAKDTDLLPR